MEFYLTALNRNLKEENENDAIGIIICKSKDKTVVEYSLAVQITLLAFQLTLLIRIFLRIIRNTYRTKRPSAENWSKEQLCSTAIKHLIKQIRANLGEQVIVELIVQGFYE